MGHFTVTVTGTGKDQQTAQWDAWEAYVAQHGTDCDFRSVERATFLRKEPPTKLVTTRSREIPAFSIGYGQTRKWQPMHIEETREWVPDPDAPPSAWLEVWEFDIHYHA